VLRKTSKKTQKKDWKRLAVTEKISNFAPALEQKFIYKLKIKQIKKTSKKLKKDLDNKK